LTWTPAGVSALNAPAGGAGMGAAARDALERDGNSLEGVFGSRSRRGLARGGASSPRAIPTRGGVIDPRARWICTEAASHPSSGAEFCPRGGMADCLTGRGPASSFCACV
jgi:hypothetical protein